MLNSNFSILDVHIFRVDVPYRKNSSPKKVGDAATANGKPGKGLKEFAPSPPESVESAVLGGGGGVRS